MASSNDPPSDGPTDAVAGTGPAAEPRVPDGERLVYDDYVDLERGPELSVVVVEALAEIRDRPVGVLAEAIDTDGLERVFRHGAKTPRRYGWVTFFFCGCRIVFDSSYRLRIYDRQGAAEVPGRR